MLKIDAILLIAEYANYYIIISLSLCTRLKIYSCLKINVSSEYNKAWTEIQTISLEFKQYHNIEFTRGHHNNLICIIVTTFLTVQNETNDIIWKVQYFRLKDITIWLLKDKAEFNKHDHLLCLSRNDLSRNVVKTQIKYSTK